MEPSAGAGIRRRGTWALVDQAIVSGGNFATNIILANVMSGPGDYGRFTLLWGVLLLLNSVHGAIVAYPLSVRGGAGGESVVRAMAGGGIAITLLLAILTLAASAVATGLLGVPEAFPWMAAAGVAWQVQETLRRAQLAAFRLRAACIGDGVSYLGQAAAVALLAYFGSTQLPQVFAWLAVTSLVAAAVQAVDLRIIRPTLAAAAAQLSLSWTLGRWVLCSSLVGMINLQAIPWVVTAFHGPHDAAMMAAVGNVLGITNPIVLGLGAVMTPSIARVRAASGLRAGVAVGTRYALLGLCLLLPIWLVIGFAPGWVLSEFYRSPEASEYRQLQGALRMMLGIYAIHFGGAMMGIILGGLEKNGWAFACSLAAVAGTLFVTLPLSARYSYMGSLAGGIVSETLRLACTLIVLIYLIRRSGRMPAAEGGAGRSGEA